MAVPYPSNISVTGQSGVILKVTVKLKSLSHTFPNDIDVLLVGPGGQTAVIMSDVGSNNDVTGVTLTFDDDAASTIITAPLVTGTFKPTNNGLNDDFPPPAPVQAGGSALAVFNGTAPNGTWSLYVVDDRNNDSGSFAGGWELALATGGCYPTPTPTPTPTPSATPISLAGNISYCTNPVPGPVPSVTLSVTGDTVTSTVTDGSGNYLLSSLAAGGSYIVTPSKAALLPGGSSPKITTVDGIAADRHFLNLGTPLSGCQLLAADVNGDAAVNTVDVIAIQRFFLGYTSGIANTGAYLFTPANRSYPGVATDQADQNYNALVLGDVVSPFVH